MQYLELIAEGAGVPWKPKKHSKEKMDCDTAAVELETIPGERMMISRLVVVVPPLANFISIHYTTIGVLNILEKKNIDGYFINDFCCVFWACHVFVTQC